MRKQDLAGQFSRDCNTFSQLEIRIFVSHKVAMEKIMYFEKEAIVSLSSVIGDSTNVNRISKKIACFRNKSSLLENIITLVCGNCNSNTHARRKAQRKNKVFPIVETGKKKCGNSMAENEWPGEFIRMVDLRSPCCKTTNAFSTLMTPFYSQRLNSSNGRTMTLHYEIVHRQRQIQSNVS